MTPEQFNAVAAAARARCTVRGLELEPEDLEPRHPAFTGFRRVTYIWEDGLTSYPIGDRAGLWLDFLRERGAAEATLRLDGGGFVIRVDHAGGADSWVAGDLEGTPLLRGRAAPGQTGQLGLDIPEAAAALRHEAMEAAQASDSPVDRDALRRAVAILGADGDGGNISDVAWPYFLLPEARFSRAARRLLAAAAAGWVCTAAPVAAAVAVNRGLRGEAAR